MVVLRPPAGKALFLTLILLVVGVLLVFFLVVRGLITPTDTAPATAPVHATAADSANASAAATAVAYMKLVTIIGHPTVKIATGATFEAVGQVKNDDTIQHDITLKIILLNASGQVVGTATQLEANVKGGATVSYSIQGTTTQTSWSSVVVEVVKVG
jgi:hypothetical protein